MTLLLPADFSPVTGVETLVAPPPKPDPGGQGEDYGKAAPEALVVLLLFFLAVALLVRSMNKHLRRVPKSFDNRPGTGTRDFGSDED
ncbi:MAG TPA: hypothetical protein VN748_07570 [Pseudonocardiaceae bacterium]|nr:hypothetical protein [Pseudonocardiaceae bacterium]